MEKRCRLILRRSRQNDGLSMIESSASEYSGPTLLTIPGELRNRIYELALLQDSKVYPFDYKPCGCDCPKHQRHPPAVALLRVNRQINREATPLLYSRVLFRLSTGYLFMKFMALGEVCMYGSPTGSEIYPSRHLIRSLRIKFVPEHMPSEVRSGHVLDCWADPNFQLLSKKQRAQSIHRYNRDVCQAVWTNAGKVITLMRELKFLSMDLEQVFCPLGCCRMVGHVVRSLKGLRKKEGFTITVSGELQEVEKRMVLGGLKYGGQAVDDRSINELSEEEEEGDDDEDDSEDDDYDDEYDEYDEDDEEEEEYEDDESLEDEDDDDAAGTSSTDAVGSHSDDSKVSLEEFNTVQMQMEGPSSSLSTERLRI